MNIDLKMEQFTRVNGKELKDMVMVSNMKDSGRTIKPVVKESFGMLTEMFLKANGKMTRLTVMEYMFI